MDRSNHLILLMAAKLLEYKARDIEAQIASIRGVVMSMDTISNLNLKKQNILQRANLIRRAVEENNQDQMQTDCRWLSEEDVF